MQEGERPWHTESDDESVMKPLREQTDHQLSVVVQELRKIRQMALNKDHEPTLEATEARITRRAYRLRLRDLIRRGWDTEDAATQTAVELVDYVRTEAAIREHTATHQDCSDACARLKSLHERGEAAATEAAEAAAAANERVIEAEGTDEKSRDADGSDTGSDEYPTHNDGSDIGNYM